MHIHARSKVNQSTGSQRAASQSIASLSSFSERVLERLLECPCGAEARPNSHFERLCDTDARPEQHFERPGGLGGCQSRHFEHPVASEQARAGISGAPAASEEARAGIASAPVASEQAQAGISSAAATSEQARAGISSAQVAPVHVSSSFLGVLWPRSSAKLKTISPSSSAVTPSKRSAA